MDWGREEWKSRAVGARVVVSPDDGSDSERVALSDVLARRVWFPAGGFYLLWQGDVVQYIGLTASPLGVRLRGAIANGKTWTRADYTAWTVTMRKAPEYPEDTALLRRLIAEYAPPYNVLGRPRRNFPPAGKIGRLMQRQGGGDDGHTIGTETSRNDQDDQEG